MNIRKPKKGVNNLDFRKMAERVDICGKVDLQDKELSHRDLSLIWFAFKKTLNRENRKMMVGDCLQGRLAHVGDNSHFWRCLRR